MARTCTKLYRNFANGPKQTLEPTNGGTTAAITKFSKTNREFSQSFDEFSQSFSANAAKKNWEMIDFIVAIDSV